MTLEEFHKQQWQEAKLKLELATVRRRRIESQMRSSPREDLLRSYRAIVEAESLAMAEYSRVLQSYLDRFVHCQRLDEYPARDGN